MSVANRYNSGLGHVPAYQAAAIPWLSSSLSVPASGSTPLEISFASVSKFVIITNTLLGGDTNVPLRFGFSSNGVMGSVDSNYGILNNGESFEAGFKVSRVYLMSDSVVECSASVIAGLTSIDAVHLALNWSGSEGVG